MSVKRILIATGIFFPEIGGPASYAMTLAKKLSNDYRVSIISHSRNSSYPEDKNLGFDVTRVSTKLPKFVRHLVYFARCYWLAKNHDIVYALNAVSAGWPASWAARLRNKKFIVKIVGDAAWEKAVNERKTALLINDFQHFPQKGGVNMLSNIQRSVCQKADGVVVPSKYLAGLVKDWGVPESKIRVIYNGVDFKAADFSKEEARKKIGVPGIVIVSIGRLVPWKGFKMLIKIMPELLKINSFFRLVIVGDGPERKNLEKMVSAMNLDRKVYIVGKKSQEEMALYLAAADMFVLNTGYEGFSHQILEVMKAGVPVITTAVGGNPEVIKQGENGFMVKYNDEFNLIQAIKTLHEMKELKESFREAGIRTTASFSHERMLQETINHICLS